MKEKPGSLPLTLSSLLPSVPLSRQGLADVGHRRVHLGFKPRKLILASPMSRRSLDSVLTWGLGLGALPGTSMPPVSGSGCR